jgi:hypothetical protein
VVTRAILFAGAIAFLMASQGAAIQPAPATSEYRIKAVFLYNFVQFTHWPATAFADASSPIVIGVLGDDPFGSSLDETIAGELIHDRKLAVRRSRKLDELKDVQLLFVSPSEEQRVAEIIAALQSRPVLLVGESDGFARHGGVIRFYLAGSKVRFEINAAAAKQHGLRLSAQLLKLGTAVGKQELR